MRPILRPEQVCRDAFGNRSPGDGGPTVASDLSVDPSRSSFPGQWRTEVTRLVT
jgi:hypothetical protein